MVASGVLLAEKDAGRVRCRGWESHCFLGLTSLVYLFLNVFSHELDLVLQLVGSVQQLVAVKNDMRRKEND